MFTARFSAELFNLPRNIEPNETLIVVAEIVNRFVEFFDGIDRQDIKFVNATSSASGNRSDQQDPESPNEKARKQWRQHFRSELLFVVFLAEGRE